MNLSREMKKYRALMNFINEKLNERLYSHPQFLTFTFSNDKILYSREEVSAYYNKWIEELGNDALRYIYVIEKGKTDRFNLHSLLFNSKILLKGWEHGYCDSQIVTDRVGIGTKLSDYLVKERSAAKDLKQLFHTNISFDDYLDGKVQLPPIKDF